MRCESRQLQLLANKDPKLIEKFKDVSIVVGKKVLRDIMNNKISW
jgi:hypothetical protein